jgi:hypothetical protein
MQAQISNWPTAVTEILKALFSALTIIGPVLITAIVSWKISRQQLTRRTAELNAESTFKAREHLFQLRREYLDRHYSEMSEAYKALGGFVQVSQNIKNDEQYRILANGLKTMRDAFVLGINLAGTVRSLQAFNMYDESVKEDLEFIREALKLNLDELTPDSIYPAVMLYLTAYNTWQGIRTVLLDKLCRSVFEDYLPKSEDTEIKQEVAIGKEKG